jgi:hypothetical protein
MDDVRNLVRAFMKAGDFSKAEAKTLEGQLGLLASSDPDLQGLLDILASYQPGGGDLLYDRPHLEKALRALSDRP